MEIDGVSILQNLTRGICARLPPDLVYRFSVSYGNSHKSYIECIEKDLNLFVQAVCEKSQKMQ